MTLAVLLPVLITFVDLKVIVGYCATSNQTLLFNSPSSFVLLVEIVSAGIVISNVLAATLLGSSVRLPDTLVNSPYQVVKPICDTLNSTRV